MIVSFRNKAPILLLCIGIMMVAGCLIVTNKSEKVFDNSAYWTEHTHEVIQETKNVLASIQDIQLGGRGYIITGDSTFLEPINRSADLYSVSIQKLKKLTIDNPYQGPRLDSVFHITAAMMEYVNYYVAIRKAKGLLAATEILGNSRGRLYLDSIRHLLNRIQAVEYKLLGIRKNANKKNIANLYYIFQFLIMIESLLIVVIFFTVRFNIKSKTKNDKSEIRFRNTLDKMLEGVEILGFDFRYLYVNQAYEKQVRHTKKQLLGFTVMEKFPGIESTEIFKTIQRCIEERVALHLEAEFTFPDQVRTWFEISFQPVPEGVFILSVDITEKKHAEQKIKHVEERFRALIENSYDIVSISDEKLRTVYRSPASMRITGWTNEDRDKVGAVEQTHPDDVEKFTDTMKKVMENPGISIPISFRTRHKEGHYIFMQGMITNMLHNESIKGIVANFHDVTATRLAEIKLRESERIYKTISSSIPGSVIVLIDKDYRYSLVEGDMLESMGYSKEKLLGHKMEDVIPQQRLTEVLPLFHRVFNGETFIIENFHRGLDTVSRFVPLRDENNQVFAAMVVIFDVSELKKAQRAVDELNIGLEHKIRERTLELEMVNKELGAFSYSVAHDLRAPLRAIYGYATMLEEDYSQQFDAEGKRLIHAVENNAKKMGLLIDDLLTFSKLGRKQIQKSLINMEQLTRSSLVDLHLADDYHGEIKIGNLDSIMADRSLMGNVMTNLLSNAIKYSSKKEKPIIEISSHKDKDEMIYSITDNGVGFDMEYADKLFGVFQRLHSDEEFDGTGVGLAIVQRIIHRHGGRIWAKSEVGKGATFYFSLPLIKDLIKEMVLNKN